MANIPVQRKSGIPWWVWALLGLVLLALLGLFLGNPFDRREAAGPGAATGAGAKASPAAAASPATGAGAKASPAAAGPVTDLPIGQPDQLAALAGRPVQLGGVKVQSVVGDKTFWVGPSATQRLFVFLEEDTTAGQKVEGKVDVNPGQTVALTGEIRRLPSAGEAQQQLNMSPQVFEAASQDQIYLFARSVQVVSR